VCSRGAAGAATCSTGNRVGWVITASRSRAVKTPTSSSLATSTAAYRSCGQIQIKTGYRVPLSVDRLSCPAGAQVARDWIRRLSTVGNRTVVSVGRYRCVWRVRTTNLVTCSSGARRARFSALD